MRVTLEYLASALLLLIIVLSGFYLSSLGFNLALVSNLQPDLSRKAHVIASNLVSSPGAPRNWEANGTFEHLGLASYSTPGELSPSKVKTLLNMDPETVWGYMRETYNIKGFKIKFRPVLNIEAPYRENQTHKWFEVIVSSNLHGTPIPGAEVDYVLLYVEVISQGGNLEFQYTNTVQGTLETDSQGKAYIYISESGGGQGGGDVVEEYILFARVDYYGYRGLGYNSSGGVSIGEEYVRYEFIISEYLEAEVVTNTLILYYREEGPTNASVRVGEDIYIFNGTGWEVWRWDEDPGQDNNILTHGQGKNTLEIPLPEYVIPYAPLLVAIPAGVSIGQGQGYVFTVIPAYYFTEEVSGGPIPEVEYGFGIGPSNRNVAYANRIVDIAGTTYILEVLVSS